MGMTPIDIAGLIPKKRISAKIIDYIKKKIAANNSDSSSVLNSVVGDYGFKYD